MSPSVFGSLFVCIPSLSILNVILLHNFLEKSKGKQHIIVGVSIQNLKLFPICSICYAASQKSFNTENISRPWICFVYYYLKGCTETHKRKNNITGRRKKSLPDVGNRCYALRRPYVVHLRVLRLSFALSPFFGEPCVHNNPCTPSARPGCLRPKMRGNFMEVQADFRDLLALFNAHKVEYIIVLS